MNKKNIKEILIKMRSSDNESSVNYLLGLLDMISDEDLSKKLEQLNLSDETIPDFLSKKILEVQLQQEHSEHFINVNKMFSYGRTGDTLHMHLIPEDLRGLKAKLGEEAFYKFYKDQLEDFLARLQDIFRNDSTISSLFAVSPIFFNPNIASLHEELGFDDVIEIDLDNSEDNMSIEQKEFFLNMFNKDHTKKRRVYYTSMSREKLINTKYERILEDDKTILGEIQ